jgi:outer membrane protein OmpU
MVDGLAAAASYSSDAANNEGSTAWGLTYTGVEGLSVSYGQGEDNSTINIDADQTIMKASYAYGPVTLSASNNDYDHTTAASDQETASYAISYTLTDSISFTYGETTIEKSGVTSDIEVEGITASYTSGGMTAAVTQVEATNVDHSSTGANNDNDFWKVSLSFAF